MMIVIRELKWHSSLSSLIFLAGGGGTLELSPTNDDAMRLNRCRCRFCPRNITAKGYDGSAERIEDATNSPIDPALTTYSGSIKGKADAIGLVELM